MARQRSRADWLKAGDQNTGYFQAVSVIRSKNRITTLKDSNGVLRESKEEMMVEVQGFYMNLYSSQEEIDVDSVLHHVPTMVSG